MKVPSRCVAPTVILLVVTLHAGHVRAAAFGQELLLFTAPDATSGDSFGGTVDFANNIAIVGARFDDDRGIDSGSAYLWDLSTGQQLFKLVPDELTVGDQFGTSWHWAESIRRGEVHHVHRGRRTAVERGCVDFRRWEGPTVVRHLQGAESL